MDHYAKLRAQIRAGRELLELNQTNLAEFLGVSLSKISRAESGETKSGDTLLELKAALERKGVRFTPSGVELVEDRIEILEGNDCYIRLFDRIYEQLRVAPYKEFLVLFGADKASSKEVNMRYNILLKNGMHFRKLISEDDNYIMGNMDWYRTVPAKYFSNVLTFVYGDKVAQMSSNVKRVVIHEDLVFSEREQKIFSHFWDVGKRPAYTATNDRYI